MTKEIKINLLTGYDKLTRHWKIVSLLVSHWRDSNRI